MLPLIRKVRKEDGWKIRKRKRERERGSPGVGTKERERKREREKQRERERERERERLGRSGRSKHKWVKGMQITPLAHHNTLAQCILSYVTQLQLTNNKMHKHQEILKANQTKELNPTKCKIDKMKTKKETRKPRKDKWLQIPREATPASWRAGEITTEVRLPATK